MDQANHIEEEQKILEEKQPKISVGGHINTYINFLKTATNLVKEHESRLKEVA